MAETFTPEHHELLHRLFLKAAQRPNKFANTYWTREFRHWSWRFGLSLHAKSGSRRALQMALACREANLSDTKGG